MELEQQRHLYEGDSILGYYISKIWPRIVVFSFIYFIFFILLFDARLCVDEERAQP